MSQFSADQFPQNPTEAAVPGAPPTPNPFGGAMFALAVAGAGVLAFGLCLGVLIAANNLPQRESSGPKDRVVFFFTAHWCPACRYMEPTVSNLQGRGYNIRKVDVDDESALASKFGVRGIPTFVLLENGYEANRHVGGMDADDLANWLQ